MLTKLLNFVNICVVSSPRRPGGEKELKLNFQGAAPPVSSLGREDASSGLRWMERQDNITGHFIFISLFYSKVKIIF